MHRWKGRLQVTVVACVLLAGSGLAASGQEADGTDRTFTPTVRVLFGADDEWDAEISYDEDVFRADVHANGMGAVHQLTETTDEWILGLPEWAPDASRFTTIGHHRTSEGHHGVAVVSAFGDLLSFAHGTPVYSLDWSPDGSRLVMSSWTRVWTAAPDGSRTREVFTVPVIDPWEGALPARASATVDWAPAGQAIHVELWVEPESASWMVDEPSGKATRIDVSFLRWHPRGTAFGAFEQGTGDLIIATTRAPDEPILRQSAPDGYSLDSPRWSPTGDRIAFTRSRHEPGGPWTEVVVIELASGTAREFSFEEVRLGVEGWSQDGASLVLADLGPTFALCECEEPPPGRGIGSLNVSTGETRWRDIHFNPGGWDSSATPTRAWLPDTNSLVGTLTRDLPDGDRRTDVAALHDDGRVEIAENPTDAASGLRIGVRNVAVSPHGLGRTVRAMGRDRVETAIDLSRGTFQSAESVVIARADAYPDALAGAPLAHQAGGPLLLTASEHLDPRVGDEVTRLGATRATILGTDDALAPEVAEELRDLGVEVERIGGRDRFETAALVADRLDTADVFLVEGIHADPSRGWPDAVAVSGLAAATGRPILLTARDHLPKGTATWLGAHQPEKVKIIGSPAAVSRRVASEVDDLAGDVVRHGGVDRYDTSKLIANLSVKAGLDPATTLLVTGRNWPDALAAAPVAAATGGVLVLTSPTRPDDVRTAVFLDMHHDDIDRAVLVGGLAALPAETQRFLHHQLR